MPLIPLLPPATPGVWLMDSSGQWMLESDGRWRMGNSGDKCCCTPPATPCAACESTPRTIRVTLSGISLYTTCVATSGDSFVITSGDPNGTYILPQVLACRWELVVEDMITCNLWHNTSCSGTPDVTSALFSLGVTVVYNTSLARWEYFCSFNNYGAGYPIPELNALAYYRTGGGTWPCNTAITRADMGESTGLVARAGSGGSAYLEPEGTF